MTLLQYYKKYIKYYPGIFLVVILLLSQNLRAQTPAFSFVVSNNCAPAVVTFYNESAILPGLTYEWNFGKGGGVVYSSEKTLEEVYTSSGSYNVTLSIINGTDTTRKTQVLSLAKGPVASINIDDTKGCAPFTVIFSDASTKGDGTITSYFWDFRNGQTSATNPTNYTYNIPGTYDIFYRITDNNGCSSFYESKQIINVYDSPVANFSASETFACQPPLFVDFNNLSQGSGALTSSWSFGNGETSNSLDASATYTNSGSFDVSLSVTDNNGCSDTEKKSRYINIGSASGEIVAVVANDTISENNSILCPDSILFTSTLSVQTDYTWVVNYNGSIQTIYNKREIKLELPDSGKIDIELRFGASGLCPDTITKSFIIDFIRADFAMNKNYTCQLPTNVQLQNLSSNAVNYIWTMPDQSQRTSTNTNYNIDRINSYAQLYTHNLITNPYSFTLVATSANGCSDIHSEIFTATPPIARFMPDAVSGCIPFTVTFSDSSKSKEKIVNWKYLIDSDALTATEKEPVPYTFNTVGVHNVYLVITNDSGCTDTSYVIKIYSGSKITPDFSVTPSDVCYGDVLNLTYNNTLPSTGISLVYSSPGLFNTGEIENGNISVNLRPDSLGTFPVKLETDYYGCKTDSVIDNAFEVLGPVGSFHKKFDCETPLSYRFISDIQGANGLKWTIGATVINNQDSIDYVFAAPGDYLVTLTASNSTTGCTLEKSEIIKVRQVTAKIEVKPVACRFEDIIFSSTKSENYIDSCYNEGFLWYWDDNTPERRTYNTDYSHFYSDTGIFHPILEVTADNGCKAYDTVDIRIVSPMPEITVNPVSGCGPNLSVQLNYTNYNTEINSWSWIFGDNTHESPSANLVVNHNYYSQNNITYYAGLRVTDIYGCSNYVNTPISIFVANSDFQANKHGICKGEQVFFAFADNDIDSFSFDFGDGIQSISSPFHQYNLTGTYSVSLTVWKNGCSSQTVKNNYIIVEETTAGYTASDELTTCYPVTIDFSHTNPSGNISSGFWDFGDGTSGYYSPTVQHTYSQPGTYTSSLQVRTLYNCIAQTTKEIVVTGPEAKFSFFPAYICSGDSVTFQLIEIKNTDSYKWYFGDGESSVEENPTHQYFANGPLTPAIQLTKDDCTVLVISENLYVSEVNADFILGSGSGKYCTGEQINTTNLSTSFSKSEWRIDGIIISEELNLVDLQYNETGVHELELIVTDIGQCHDTTTKIFTVNEIPSFEITGDTLICAGSPAALSIPDFKATWNVYWEPQDIMSSNFSPTTQASPEVSTIVYAVVTDTSGCFSLETHTINIKNDFSVTRIPLGDTSIFIGQNIELFINANAEDATYNWEPKSHISCDNCPNPVVSPFETTTYIVTTSDGCSMVTLEFLVEVIVDHYLELPTAFTPNEDGENDIYYIESKNIAEAEFKIFNRWGNLIFSTDKVDEGWNGQYNGKTQNIDTYTYFIKAKTIHGYEFEKKGTFLLLK